MPISLLSTSTFSHARHCPAVGPPFFLATRVAKSNVLPNLSAPLLVSKLIFNPRHGARLSTNKGRQPGEVNTREASCRGEVWGRGGPVSHVGEKNITSRQQKGPNTRLGSRAGTPVRMEE